MPRPRWMPRHCALSSGHSPLGTLLRQDLADVEQRIKANTWLAELEAGRSPTEALQAFAGEQPQIIPSHLRSFEMLAQRFPADPAYGYLTGMAAAERVALSALEVFAAAVGLDGAARPLPPQPGELRLPRALRRPDDRARADQSRGDRRRARLGRRSGWYPPGGQAVASLRAALLGKPATRSRHLRMSPCGGRHGCGIRVG